MSFIRKIKKGDKVYLAEVENVRIDGIVRQRHIKYIGKEADGKKILSSSISNIEIEQIKLSGPLLVLNHIAKEINLSNILGEYGDEILSLIFAHCIDYKSINQMSRWFERTDLNMILDLDGVTEARLLQALDSLVAQDPTKLQVDIFNSVKEKYKVNNSGIIYDVTNTYLYGKKCSLGKLGKDKDGIKGRPLIQIGLGVTKIEGIPVFHKVFDGNIHDTRTFSDSLTAFKEYRINKGIIIFDKGVHSKRNQKDAFSLDWKVLCGLPLDKGIKPILKNVMTENIFEDYKNRIKLNETVFYAISKPFSIDDIKGTIIFCFNEQQKKDLKESRYDEISNAQILLKEKKKIKPELDKYFDKEGNLLLKKLKEAEEFDGFSCIFTTTSLPKEKVVQLYFDKDMVEKAFQSLKGVVKVQPIRHWLYNRVVAHVFICYLSYLLLSLLKYKLKKIGISPIEALKELDSLYRVYIRDAKKGFKMSRMVALTKKQEAILRCIDKKLIRQSV
jgi:transposase